MKLDRSDVTRADSIAIAVDWTRQAELVGCAARRVVAGINRAAAWQEWEMTGAWPSKVDEIAQTGIADEIAGHEVATPRWIPEQVVAQRRQASAPHLKS